MMLFQGASACTPNLEVWAGTSSSDPLGDVAWLERLDHSNGHCVIPAETVIVTETAAVATMSCK